MMALRPLARREYAAVALLLAFSFFIRTVHVIGHGLGDDAFYSFMANSFLQRGFDALPLSYGGNYRFGILLPVAASFLLFGINDPSYILLPIASSVFLVLAVYLIARRLAGPDAAIFAGIVQSVSTFDVAFASSMTIDIPLSLAFAGGICFLLYGEGKPGKVAAIYGLAAALCIIWAYYIKTSGVAIVAVYAIFSLLRRQHIRQHAFFYLFFTLLFSSTFIIDFLATGDVLNQYRVVQRALPNPGAFSELWAEYPKWMFLKSEHFDEMFFGLHFWLAVLALAYCALVKSARVVSLPSAAWLLVIFSVMEFAPQTFGLPYLLPFRFFRHTHVFVAPAAILSGIFLADVWRRGSSSRVSRILMVFLLLSYSADSIIRGFALGSLYESHYDDVKAASDFLLQMPEKTIISDGKFQLEYSFRSGHTDRRHQVPSNYNGLSVQHNIVHGGDMPALYGLHDAYVVVGGSRGVDYGLEWILQKGGYELPPNWEVVWRYPEPPDKYRPEPMVIYYVR